MSERTTLLHELLARAGLGHISKRVVLLAAAAGVMCVGGVALASQGDRGQAFELDVSADSEATSTTLLAADPSGETTLVVHVAGAVVRPGLVWLPAGSRVGDAIDSAGGALGSAGLDALNLARVLADGEQVYVPDVDELTQGDGSPRGLPAPGFPSLQSAVPPLIDLNSADVSALDTLPGVGPSTAAKIIADRESNGPFASIDDLQRVSGIGPKRIEEIRGLVEVR